MFADARYYNGSVYAPLRSVAEVLGAEVSWNQEAQKAIVSADEATLEVFVNENKIYVDGKTTDNVHIFIENGVTYAPVRLVCESMGAEVEWNNERKAVNVKKAE